MSKDKPEVGDVWENRLTFCYVVRVTNDLVEIIVCNKPYHYDTKYYTTTCNDNFLKAYWRFKCKSKTSLDDLFKTENEE